MVRKRTQPIKFKIVLLGGNYEGRIAVKHHIPASGFRLTKRGK